MPTSEARIQANRQNASRSTGPKTPEGKERSRGNGLKHGLTGQRVVLPEGDLAEVERREVALRQEMAPKSEKGVILVLQLATLSVRMERGAKQEFAAIATRVRHAADDFDEDRIEKAEALLKSIGDDPRGNLRRLRKSPEGVDLLLDTWQDLRTELTRESNPSWTEAHLVRAANLLGIKEENARDSRIGVLSRGTWGDFAALAGFEGGDLGDDARRSWAKARLVERINDVIAGLEDHYEDLDHERIAQDRAEAGDRALFDPSKPAALARRYESEARRGFFRALKEFREAEAEAAALAASSPSQASRSTGQSPTQLGSSWDFRNDPKEAPLPAMPQPLKPTSGTDDEQADFVRGANGCPLTIGRAVSMVP